MGIMSFLKGPDINAGIKEFKETKGAVLIDVRDPGEFSKGHVPGAVSMPLSVLDARSSEISNKSTPIYVYCLAGGRAGQGASILKSKGFTNVKNIGGIKSYKGPVEKSKGRSF